jgi:S-methylmethionine-dependent homocysteine/selenocysteine methylase
LAAYPKELGRRESVAYVRGAHDMAKYRDRLPQIDGRLFLTDGGIETTLIFNEGLDLPCFAAFHLLRDEKGTEALRQYYRGYASIARDHGVGFVLESATWRASADWGARLGYSPDSLADANRKAIALLHELRRELETDHSPMVISGCIGPRGDGYRPDTAMTPEAAQAYHADQARVFAESDVDLVTAITMTNSAEAIGVTRAAQRAGLPVVISFTVETDGRLPTGESLGDAIEAVDRATGEGPTYFMINCAHPTHFAERMAAGQRWVARIRGLRANASKCSHAELDEATVLDDGDPVELGQQYRELCDRFSHINVLGGCCGTDHRHLGQICDRVLAAQRL